jgi:subtilisin family serine protease
MRAYIFTICLILAGPSLWAQPFNGYLVKLKAGFSATKLATRIAGVQQHFSTQVGSFLVVKSKQKILKDSAVDYIEPNWIYTLDQQSYDAGFGMQWGLKNLGTNILNGVAGEDINAVAGWKITTGSTDVVIAVIDSGIDLRHPDLQSQLWVNEAEKNGMPMLDDDGNGYIDDIYGYNFVYDDSTPPIDGNSHGTHCAGVIGAAHNGLGVMGVMAHVRLMPLKFASDGGSAELADALQAIDYAVVMGANIISASWGGEGESQALYDAIKNAKEHGVLFVAAAGNSGNNTDLHPHYPSSYDLDNIISVGAFNPQGQRASFSNYGATSVDIFAPGVDIFSTVKEGGYALMSGTSMATPFVAGVAGLALSINPQLTAAELRQKMIDSSNRSRLTAELGQGGRVDLVKLLESVE